MMQVSAQTSTRYQERTRISRRPTFPYGYGAFFLQQVWLHNPSWTAVNRIYSTFPTRPNRCCTRKSTGRARQPKPVDRSTVSALGNWKTTYRNVLGEFSLGLLLNQLERRAFPRSAAGWGGTRFCCSKTKREKRGCACIVWDNLARRRSSFRHAGMAAEEIPGREAAKYTNGILNY